MRPALLKTVLLFLLVAVTQPQAMAGNFNTESAAPEVRQIPLKIYKYSSGGTTSFSDRPPADGRYTVLMPTCFACNLQSNVNWQTTALYAQRFAGLIEQAARQFQLDPALVRAVIHAESGFNPAARSSKGAMGLMQLMPGTARQMGVADAWMPEQNIAGGVQYLAGLLQQFRGDQKLAVAAYNAGPEAVRKYAGIPPYAETQAYVQRVQILQQRYRQGAAG
jgi:soluble lytic murein transglycosylase-like protein